MLFIQTLWLFSVHFYFYTLNFSADKMAIGLQSSSKKDKYQSQ